MQKMASISGFNQQLMKNRTAFYLYLSEKYKDK